MATVKSKAAAAPTAPSAVPPAPPTSTPQASTPQASTPQALAARTVPPMPAPADSLAAMDDVLAKGRDTLQQAVTQGAETTRVVLDKATALMRDTADQAQVHLTGSVADMAALSRDSFDTAVETGAELVKTVETLHKAQFDLLARAMDSAVATAKALSEAKSANELIAVQTDYVRGAADSLMVETTRMVELAGKMMQDVAQPCQARFTATWDRIGKSVAV